MAEAANTAVDRSVDIHLGSWVDCRCRNFAWDIVASVAAAVLLPHSRSRLHRGEPLRKLYYWIRCRDVKKGLVLSGRES